MNNKAPSFRTIIPFLDANVDHPDEPPAELELLTEGEWFIPKFEFFNNDGHLQITLDDLEQYKANFEAGIPTDMLPVDEDHDRGRAMMWVESMEIKASSKNPNVMALWGNITYTPVGRQKVLDKEWRYFSPEFSHREMMRFEDPMEAGKFFDNVVMGGGLTNRPLMRDLTPVAAIDDKKGLTQSSQRPIIYLNTENANTMDLQSLLEKKPEDLTAEEKSFVGEHKNELTEDQAKTLTEAGVLKAEGGDGGDGGDNNDGGQGDGGDGSGTGEGAGNSGGDSNGDGGGDNQPAANRNSNSVVMSREEAEALKADAKAGREAHEQLALQASSDHIESLLFNSRTGGKLPTTTKDSAVKLYHGLSANQRKLFDEIFEKLPNSQMFSSKGDAGTNESSAASQVMSKVNSLMADNKDMTQREALDKVRKDEPQLYEQYQDEQGQGE